MNTDKKLPADTAEDKSADISPQERALLDESMENMISVDNNNLRESALDSTDEDGDKINESTSNLTGEDLDIPGTELDNANEEIGEEDEENNGYSTADTE